MLARFPSLYHDFLNNYDEIERTLVHVIVGQLFTSHIIKTFCSKQNYGEERQHIVDFMEDMATSQDEEVRAVLAVSVLEQLLVTPECFEQVSPFFKAETRVLANDVQKMFKMFWG